MTTSETRAAIEILDGLKRMLEKDIVDQETLDNDVIKSAEICSDTEMHCRGCAYDDRVDCLSMLCKDLLGISKHQKAEIEGLQKAVEEAVSCFNRMESLYNIKNMELKVAKAEARTEFAERLKEDISNHRAEMFWNGLKGTPRTQEITYECVEEYIDQIAKELKGESEWGMQKLQQPQGDNDVKCKDCEYLMFSDCYGECRKAYKGIVNPNDSCGKGKKRVKGVQ